MWSLMCVSLWLCVGDVVAGSDSVAESMIVAKRLTAEAALVVVMVVMEDACSTS